MPTTAFNPSDLMDVFVMHNDLMPAVGSAVDTPSGSWIDVTQYEYVLAVLLQQDAIGSETNLLVKVQESDAATGASPVDVVNIFNAAPASNAGAIKEIRTHARKKFLGVLANQTGGATGQPITILLIGVKTQQSSAITAFASQPITSKGPIA